MLDAHFHCLPFIDDGPSTWDESVALCRAAADEGVTVIVATPHVLRDPWINHDPAARRKLVDHLNDLLGGSPKILPGCELYYTPEVVDLWEQGPSGPLTMLGEGSHLLIEFPSTNVPRGAELVFHELQLLGITPVIAHPERNLEFARTPARLAALVERGAKTQITAAVLTGEMGEWPLEAALKFHDLGLVHLVASDAHSLDRRPPRLAAARQAVEEMWGNEEAVRIFDTNAKALLPPAPSVP